MSDYGVLTLADGPVVKSLRHSGVDAWTLTAPDGWTYGPFGSVAAVLDHLSALRQMRRAWRTL